MNQHTTDNDTKNDPDSIGNNDSWLTRTLQKVGLIDQQDGREALLEQLREASKDESVLNRHALSIVEGAITCADMQAREIMVARSQIESINIDNTRQQILRIVVETGHSRFPVFDRDNKEVLGILLAKDLIALMLQNTDEHIDLLNIMRPIAKINESKSLLVLLNEFQEQRNHMAIVYDEYGDIAGIITIEDVLEVIVGDISDEYDTLDSDHIRAIDDKHFIIKAITPLDEFNEYFATDFTDNEVDTIGGLIMLTCKRIPKRDDTIVLGKFSFKVMQADKKRIYLLRLTTK